ncbi:hypothetical protein CQ022_18335 [Chryseobacterium culicis]|uniref:Uncharacterized protein n=1 Tax=Chryseobacterium culicis TaxID=680127 RepID=A0A2S9CMA0_CHRCI|nr:hypothetical protein CQ022_18335 [Chryseobacterium culicis]PRB88297.1 hypothetical protein CQ033_17230 [Chryseobacterium culicis]
MMVIICVIRAICGIKIPQIKLSYLIHSIKLAFIPLKKIKIPGFSQKSQLHFFNRNNISIFAAN